MTKLSVNINKVATLRNARGGNNPDVVKVAWTVRRLVRKVSLYILVPMNGISAAAMCTNFVRCLPQSLTLKGIPHRSSLIWC